MTKPPKVGPALPRRLESLRRRLSGLDPHDARPPDRVERVASRFGSAFSITASIALMLVIVAVGFVAVKEFLDDSVYLEPISVPPGLVEQGITPTVVAARVVQRVAAIKAEADRRDVATEAKVSAEQQRQELVLIGGGVSVARLVSASKRALGQPDLRVVGEIVRVDGKLRMGATFLKNGARAETDIDVDGPVLDSIADRGAKLVLLLSNPDVLTSYTLFTALDMPPGRDKFKETLAILDFRERAGFERASPAVRNWRAIVDVYSGNLAAARKVWEALAAEGWKPVQSTIYAALASMILKDFDRAIAYYDQARASPLATGRQLAEIGSGYKLAGRSKDHLDTSLLALRRSPDNAYVRAVLAESLQDLHRVGEARQLLDSAPMPRTNSEFFLLHVSVLASIAARQGDFQRVEELLRQSEKDYPDAIYVQWMRAEHAFGRGDLTAADRSWQEQAKVQPFWNEPPIRRADIASLRGDFTTALTLYDACLETFPFEARCRVGRARTLFKLGKPADADLAFAHLFAMDKDDVKAMREWSAVLTELGRKDEAAQKLTLAAEAERRLAIPIDIPGAGKR